MDSSFSKGRRLAKGTFEHSDKCDDSEGDHNIDLLRAGSPALTDYFSAEDDEDIDVDVDGDSRNGDDGRAYKAIDELSFIPAVVQSRATDESPLPPITQQQPLGDDNGNEEAEAPTSNNGVDNKNKNNNNKNIYHAAKRSDTDDQVDEKIIINNNKDDDDDDDRSNHKIDFLKDNPQDMTYGRRIALWLMNKYGWYNPQIQFLEDGTVRPLDDSAVHVVDGGNFRSEDGYPVDISKEETPSLAKAWAYFDHVALPRYVYREKAANQEKKGILTRIIRKFSKKDKQLDRAEPGEASMATRLYSAIFTPHKVRSFYSGHDSG